jgi:hypothetical protein
MKGSMFNIKNLLYIAILVGIIGLFGLAGAEAATFQTTGSPDDTTSGTVITAEGTDLSVDYQDTTGHTFDTVFGPTSEVTVLPVYGFSMALLDDKTLYVGQTATNDSSITIEGNDSDQITMTFEAAFVNTTGTWTVLIKERGTGNTVATLTPGSPTGSTQESLGEDADFGYYHEVSAPSTGGTPAAYVIITTEASTANTPTGQYTGANGLTYGGQGFTSEATRYDLMTPLMQLTRVSTVDAPRIYDTLASATHYDPVPGAIITYTLSYANAGNSSAEGVVIVNKVPTSEGIFQTHLAHFNVSGETTNVTIEAGQGTAAGGWAISYSTLDNPSKAYGNTADWSGGNGGSIGTINNASSDYFPASETYYVGVSAEAGAKWVKWERASVPSAESDTLTFGVTIR